MPIPIIIVILAALFTLGKMNQPAGSSAQVESQKMYKSANKKQNHDTLVEVANEGKGEAAVAGEQPETGEAENNFRIWTLYHVIE